MVGRVTELEKLIDTLGFLEGTLAGEGQRVPGEVRVQSHSLAAGNAVGEFAGRKKLLTNAAAGEGSYLEEFSELEMDRYDDFNILFAFDDGNFGGT